MSAASVRRVLAVSAFAFALLPIAASQASTTVIRKGCDLFTTRAGTNYDFGGFAGLGLLELEGRPLRSFDFARCGGGLVILPETDTIVRRLADAQATGPITIPIELIALQLQSVDPVDIGNGPEFIRIDLNTSVSGNMTINGLATEGVPHGTFDSQLNFSFDVSGTVSGFLGTITESLSQTGTNWQHFAPPGEPLILGVNHLLNGVDELADFWLLQSGPGAGGPGGGGGGPPFIPFNFVPEGHPGTGIHIAGPKMSQGSVGPCGFGPVVPAGGVGFFPDVKTLPLQTSDFISVPWCVHHGSFVPNLVGYRFSLLYDQSEIDVIHTGATPPFGNITPGGLTQMATPGISSIVTPLPSSSSPGSSVQGRTQTVWLSPSVASMSGTSAFTSSSFTFATFLLHARHTSLTNSDQDFVVGVLSPILHATTTLPSTTTTSASALFSVWSSVSQTWFLTSMVGPSSYYINVLSSAIFADAGYLGLEHSTKVPVLGAGGFAVLTGGLMLAARRVLRRRQRASSH